MENLLLEREKEFIKLNEELNIKCNDLNNSNKPRKKTFLNNNNNNNNVNRSITKPIKTKQTIVTNNSYRTDLNNRKVSLINNDLNGNNNNCSNVLNKCSGNHYLNNDIKIVKNIEKPIETDIKSINLTNTDDPFLITKSNVNDNHPIDKLLTKTFVETSSLSSKDVVKKCTDDYPTTTTTTTTTDDINNNCGYNNCGGVIKGGKSKNVISTRLSDNNNVINTIPEKFVKKNISSDGLIKFLKAKVTILQQELESCTLDNNKKAEELLKFIEIHKKITIVKDQTITKNNAYKVQIGKLEERNTELELKLKEKDVHIQSINKQFDGLKKDSKSLTITNSNLESRLTKTLEDLEHTKKNFFLARDNEKEIRDSFVQERKFYEDQIRLLRKQRSELITAYKKQLLLLDNLKKQNLCLEQSKLIDFAEKDFTKILEWNKFKK